MKEESVASDRPIICGTDFSPAAEQAVEVAAALAKRLGSELILVHVQEFQGLAGTDPALFDAICKKKHAQLQRIAEHWRKTGIATEQTLLSGAVFEELIKTAAKKDARFLVVGAVGHGLAHRIFIGSVAERAAQTSTVPTIVVRPDSALVEWSRSERPLKILLGSDFSEGGDAALRCARELQALPACEIHVAHVDWHRNEEYRLGLHGLAVLPEDVLASQQMLQRDLSERVDMVLQRANVSRSIVAGWQRADSHLLDLAKKEAVDLLLIGGRAGHRLYFGAVGRALLHHATISLGVAKAAPSPRPTKLPRFDRVLVATNFAYTSSDTARYACALVRRNGKLKIIHVAKRETADQPAEADDNFNPKIVAQLRALVPPQCAEDYEIELEICLCDDAAAGIAREADSFDADLICVDAPQANGDGSGEVLRRLLSITNRPVLVLQRRKESV